MNILKWIFGEKDAIKVHKDMEVERIKDHLWIRSDLQPQSICQTMGTLCYEP